LCYGKLLRKGVLRISSNSMQEILFYAFYAVSTTIGMIQLESFHYLENNEEDTFYLSDPGTIHFFSVWVSVGIK
jgi:hypothetical protein